MEHELGENLGLDIDTLAKDPRPRARVVLTSAAGFTRASGAPTLTSPCISVAELEREVDRLKRELDAAVATLRENWREPGTTAPEPVQPETAPRASSEAALLDTNLRVADVMTREVRSVDRNDALSLADELMKAGGFRHVVVTDAEGAVAGVVSQRDLFHGALAWSLGQGSEAHRKALEACPVKQVMQCDVRQTTPDTPLAEAAREMLAAKIGCLPVVERERLVGILTESDLLALIVPA